jgi:diguanylate cyclase (GGDEF)-like protein
VVLTRAEYFGRQAVIAVARDISDRKQAEAESERLAALSRENPNPVLECDATGRPVHVNPAAAAAARELGVESVAGMLPQDHEHLVKQSLERGEGFQNVEVMTAGRIFEWTYRPHPASGAVHLFAAEVTGRRLMEEQLRHGALHDALTDLPNRLLFMERLEHVVQRARRREGSLFAVLFLDLDRFKVINDSLGHHIGDELLIALADRLRVCVRVEDTVARFGGDEFAILVESISDVSDATRVAERIHETLSAPIELEGFRLVTSASVGIALGASAEELPTDLLRNADVAMYRAKAAGPGRFEVFDRGMHVAALGRLQMETELRYALERGELVLQYQPVVEIATGRIASLEALIRWRHPERGWLQPAAFIPLAEETGMVRPIGAWVLHEACRQLVAWREGLALAAPPSIAVNISTRQFARDELMEQVQNALLESGLAAGALCLEITESAMMDNVEAGVGLLQRLKELGVGVCVDDFGTGYSSLSYLHRFPLDEVKIDRSFVSRMIQEKGTRQLVRTMTTLAHSLGARSVAEGVETVDELELLREMGADFAQGFLFSRPLDPERVEELLRREGTIGPGPEG